MSEDLSWMEPDPVAVEAKKKPTKIKVTTFSGNYFTWTYDVGTSKEIIEKKVSEFRDGEGWFKTNGEMSHWDGEEWQKYEATEGWERCSNIKTIEVGWEE